MNKRPVIKHRIAADVSRYWVMSIMYILYVTKYDEDRNSRVTRFVC